MDISKLNLYTSNRAATYSAKLRENFDKVLSRTSTSAINEVISSYTSAIMKAGSCITINLPLSYDKFRAETYNGLMDEIKVDIKSLYSELDAMIALLNNMYFIIDTYYSETEDKVNLLNTRIKSLEHLQSVGKAYDDITYETFINQSNIHQGLSALAIPYNSGLMRLPVDEHMPVYTEGNDADVSIDILNRVTLLNDQAGIPSETDPSLAIVKEVFTDAIQNITYSIGRKNLSPFVETYNGVVGIVSITFPSVRHFNNISFRPYSNAEMDVLGIYYTSALNAKYTDSVWTKLDLAYDTSNFNSYEFNFEQKAAKRIIIVLGQSHFITDEIKVPREIFNISNRSTLSIATVERDRLKSYRDTFEKIITMSKNYKTDGQIMKAIYDNNLDESLYAVDARVQKLLLALEDYITKEESKYVTLKTDLYKLGLYSLDIQYNNYRANGYFESKPIEYDSNIHSIRLLTDENTDTDKNIIQWSLKVNEQKLPVLPINYEGQVIDTFTVIDVSQRHFQSRFLMSKVGMSVAINGATITDYVLDTYSTSATTGITINSNVILNRDDVITFKYNVPATDKFDATYDATTVNFTKLLNLPHIEHRELYDSDPTKSKTLVKTLDNKYYAYPSGVIKMINFVNIDGNSQIVGMIDGDVLLPTGSDINTIYGSGNVSVGQIQVSAEPAISKHLIYTTDIMLPYKDHHYNGVFMEEVFPNNTVWKTGVPYYPGSLTVQCNGSTVRINEYTETSGLPPCDKQIFTLNDGAFSNPISVYCTYIPITIPIENRPSGYVSNLKQHNIAEKFESALADNTIVLAKTPFTDKFIISDSTLNDSTWIFVDGSFINKRDTNIIYKPIEITVNGDVARNVTNYQSTQSTSQPSLEVYDIKLNNITYYIKDKIVYFNTKVQGDIIIKYYGFESNVAITAEAVRYTKANDTITPEVYSYAVLADLE